MNAFIVLLIAVLVSTNRGLDGTWIPKAKWPYAFTTPLGDNAFLFWTLEAPEITFELHVRTRGYVGFGLSPTGAMTGADLVVSAVRDGNHSFVDMYAVKNARPFVDTQQDWTLLDAEKANGCTVLHFKRLLDTGDCDHDIAITTDSVRVMWAYSDDDDTLVYHHGLRGSRTVFLLENGAPKKSLELPAADLLWMDFRVPNVTVPSTSQNWYWCQTIPIPRLTRKHHVIKFSPLLDKKRYVHHIITYACYHDLDPSLHHFGFECYSATMPDAYRRCRAALTVSDVGGDDEFAFPANAGVSLGTDRDPKYIMLELHYSNVDRREFVDSSGMRLWYTPNLRQHDVGVLFAGETNVMDQVIPPGTTFVTHGLCSGQCLRRGMGDLTKGIHVFAYVLHAHLLGRKIQTRHVRNGVQIGWLGKDSHYDFNYQQTRSFSKERVVLPTDDIITECHYDSSARKNVTHGALSALDEMCFAILFYYPRVNMSWCTSFVPLRLQADVVGIPAGDDKSVWQYQKKPHPALLSALGRVTWNATTIASLQQLQMGRQRVSCESVDGRRLIEASFTAAYPAFTALNDNDRKCPVH